MTDPQPAYVTQRFEAERPRLERIALRMLGSKHESDDALQETWLRASRAGLANVTNVEGWLTAIVSRVCLDALERRARRREELTPDDPRGETAAASPGEQPEDEAVLADAIGLALAVLLDALPPAERVAFVLHDLFDVPFEHIAAILEKSPDAARQLGSRARRRVRGRVPAENAALQRRDELVRAFLAASRAGNFRALVALLHPGVTVRADAAVIAMGGAAYWKTDRLAEGIGGAETVARMFAGSARGAQPVFLDGEPAAAWIQHAVARVAFRFTIADDRIAAIEVTADPETLARLDM